MKYAVLLTRDAERDLEEIYDYIAESDSFGKADSVLDKLQKTVDALASFPDRGAYPRELQALGIHEYRQTFFKPYRIIYRVTDKQVIIFMISDGRRDMQTLLAQRLLAG